MSAVSIDNVLEYLKEIHDDLDDGFVILAKERTAHAIKECEALYVRAGDVLYEAGYADKPSVPCDKCGRFNVVDTDENGDPPRDFVCDICKEKEE